MPRKSAASLEVVQIEEHLPRIEPPAHLSGDEKTLFRAIVKECHPQHFVKSDAKLLRRAPFKVAFCSLWLLPPQ